MENKLTSLTHHYDILQLADYSNKNASQMLANVEIVFGWKKTLGAQLLATTPSRLRWIQAYSAGVDGFDLDYLAKRQIQLTTASGVHGIPISESVLATLLSYYRGTALALDAQKQKQWQPKMSLDELHGKHMLIVGTGKIGRTLAERAQALGVQVAGVNHLGHPASMFETVYPLTQLKHALGLADIVVNLLPLTPETTHFYAAEQFQHMKDGVIFINVGRGKSVDSNALYDACQTGKIALAALDVLEEEPLPPTHPLWSLPNVWITPHIAGNTPYYLERVWTIFQKNLQAYLTTGHPTENVVDYKRGY